MKSRVLGMLVLMSCLLSQGCAMLMPSYSKPDVSLANVEMLKSNLWEQSFRLKLRVENPNSKALPIRGMQYQVYLNDMRLATGVSNNRFDVPAYGSETFDLEVRSNLWRHLADLVELVDKQRAVTYRIEGHISTGLFLAPNINLKEEGTLEPSQLSF